MIEKKGVEVSNVPGIGGSFRVEATVRSTQLRRSGQFVPSIFKWRLVLAVSPQHRRF